MKEKKSRGIIGISIAEITIGLYGLFLTLNILFSLSKTGENLTSYWADQFYGAMPFSIVSLCGALLVIFLGIFLFKRKHIVRVLHIVLSPLIAIILVNVLLKFVVGLISYLNLPFLLNLNVLLIAAILIITISIGYIYYFTRPKVKNQFSPTPISSTHQ